LIEENTMKNRGSFVLPALTALVLGSPVLAHAESACNEATLNGTYGYHYKGAVAEGEGLGRVAAIGLLKFDGRGKVTGSETRSTSGKVARSTFAGTYTVNPDCSGIATGGTLPQPTQFEYVILDDTRELQMAVSTDGFATLGVGKKKNADASCNVGLVQGSYGFALDGYYFLGPLAGYMSLSGIYHADGKGNLTATDVVSHNGTISRRSYAGTYTLGPDCTGVWSSTMPDGRVIEADFLTVADGRFEGVFIVTEPGTVMSGADKRIRQ
jgi:hypothetical protein